MIGVDSIEPNTPPLEIENVPPVQFLDRQLAVLRRLPKSRDGPLDLVEAHLVGVAQ